MHALVYAMATSRREPRPNASSRINRTTVVRNVFPVLKRSESVPIIPPADRRRSSASNTACRPSPSSSNNNPRTASASRSSTSVSASSSTSAHGKSTTLLLRSVSATVGAKQAAAASVMMRRRAADSKSAGGAASSAWPRALTTSSTALPNKKDPASCRAAAKPPSSNNVPPKSTRPGAEKTAAAAPASSQKPKSQKAAAGPAASSSSARNPGATAKRRTTTTSVPPPAAKAEEHLQDVELSLMEALDEMESISTPSIEEHLQERLPDPLDVVTAPYAAASEDAPGLPFNNYREGRKNDQGVITDKRMFSEGKHEDLNGGGGDDVVDGTKLNEAAGSETELSNKEADRETELIKDLEESAVRKEVHEAQENTTALPATTKATNEVTEEEGRSKTTTQQARRNKVMALVGKFETVMATRQ